MVNSNIKCLPSLCCQHCHCWHQQQKCCIFNTANNAIDNVIAINELFLLAPTVEIHNGHCGNKVDGLFKLNELNKSTSRTAGRGLKTKQRDNKQGKRRSETNEARRTRLLGT